MRRRFKLELIGAFLLLLLLAALGVSMRSSNVNASNAGSQTHSKNVSVQVERTTNSAQENGADATSVHTDTSVSSDAASGTPAASTQVTVNGQTVPVPANGSTEQTMSSPGQQTTVQVTNNQSSDGNANGHSFTHSSVHISSSSVSNSTQEEDTSP